MKKLAVLIDADNASHKTIGLVLQEIARYGTPIIKRVYSDWSGQIDENGALINRLTAWRDVSLAHAITPVHQFAYTKGKDATDMMLIIDAMDLLHDGNVDGFCIISSDSDFTPLASCIRESGLMVYGFGKKQTPSAFINACDKFIYVENLSQEDIEDSPNLTQITQNPDDKQAKTPENQAKHKVENQPENKPIATPNQTVNMDEATLQLIYKSIKDVADDGWANLSTLGSHLAVIKPDFDS